jgi:hypothetical protein
MRAFRRKIGRLYRSEAGAPIRNRCFCWAQLPASPPGEYLAAVRLAEGEELGSNLLQVCLRSPASNYANGIPALATKHTYDLIFGVPCSDRTAAAPGNRLARDGQSQT